MVQYNTIQYNTIQYNTIQYNTIQYNTIQYNTIQTILTPLHCALIQTHKELDVKAATEKVVQWERKGKYLQDIWSWGVALGGIVRLDYCGNSEGGAVGSQGQESATHLAVSPAVAVSSLASRYLRRSGNDDVPVAVCCRVLQLYRWCVVSWHQGIVILFVKGTPLTRWRKSERSAFYVFIYTYLPWQIVPCVFSRNSRWVWF